MMDLSYGEIVCNVIIDFKRLFLQDYLKYRYFYMYMVHIILHNRIKIYFLNI